MRRGLPGAALAALILAAPVVAWAGAASRMAFWVVPEVTTDWPTGGFDAPPTHPLLHAAGFAVLHREAWPFGIRIDAGTASFLASAGGVVVTWPTPAFRTTLRSVRAGEDLRWISCGLLSGSGPGVDGSYVYATMGTLHVRPTGEAEVDATVSFDLPGLPRPSDTWVANVGGGSTFPLDRDHRIALVSEIEYQRSGDVDFVRGIAVDNSPSPHYAVHHGAIERIGMRLGLAVHMEASRAGRNP